MRRIGATAIAIFALSAGTALAIHRTDGSVPAPADVVQAVTHVPRATLNQVGEGKLYGQSHFTVTALSGSPLESGGKPEVLALELAWCPHCAANSWGLAIALSRFGTFSGLRVLDTGTLFGTKFHAHPAFPHTHGVSFWHVGYSSSYLSFVDVTQQNVKGHNLQHPTAAQGSAISAFDPQGTDPAIDVGGRYGFVNSAFSPGLLAHKSWSQIASDLADATSGVAKGVDGLANVLTAAICTATNMKPASVCDSKGVTEAAARL